MYTEIFQYRTADLSDVVISDGYDPQVGWDFEATFVNPNIESAWHALERQPPERKRRTLVSFIAALLS